MLALFFNGTLKLQEMPAPLVRPGEVLIRITLAGICGTDLEVLKGYHDFTGIPGHEFVGVVADPGDSPWLGQRVVGEINLPCGRCELCRRGLEHHCRERRVLGLKGRDGAFAQYLALPAANLHAVPPEVTDAAAVFTEPLAAALAALDAASPAYGDPVLVVGDGRLGLLIAWVLALQGTEVHLAGHYPENLNLARPYGVMPFLERDLPPWDYGVVVEASGVPAGLELALARVRPRGLVVLKSTYAGRYALASEALVVPEVRLVGSRCGPFAPALRLLRQGWVDPRPLISQTFPLSQGLEAFERARRPGVLKVLLDCRGEAA
jgi:threonine dehydrogenase-like Zn-dependent dehydrogenase